VKFSFSAASSADKKASFSSLISFDFVGFDKGSDWKEEEEVEVG